MPLLLFLPAHRRKKASSAEEAAAWRDGVSFDHVAPRRPEEMAELRSRHAKPDSSSSFPDHRLFLQGSEDVEEQEAHPPPLPKPYQTSHLCSPERWLKHQRRSWVLRQVHGPHRMVHSLRRAWQNGSMASHTGRRFLISSTSLSLSFTLVIVLGCLVFHLNSHISCMHCFSVLVQVHFFLKPNIKVLFNELCFFLAPICIVDSQPTHRW